MATTRVETMLGDTAVAVHPEDQRYKVTSHLPPRTHLTALSYTPHFSLPAAPGWQELPAPIL